MVEEVAPTVVVVPPTANRKRGRPPKTQTDCEMGQSSGRSLTMLSPSLRVAQTMQFDLRPEDDKRFDRRVCGIAESDHLCR